MLSGAGRAVEAEKTNHPVPRMYGLLAIPCSSNCAWRHGSGRRELGAQVRRVFDGSRQTFGVGSANLNREGTYAVSCRSPS